jgi:DNA-directed RNA polymerase II subunit RPB2
MGDIDTFIDKYVNNFKFVKTMDDPEKTKERIIFRRFIKNTAGAVPLLESFNDWADNIFASQIENQSFTAEDGTIIELKNPVIHKPAIVINGEEKILYPQYCRDNSIPYKGRISIDCHATKKNGEKISTKIDLGYIPIMLGSKLCNLYGKTEEELVELKECITDPFGYFLLKTERSVIIQDKKRTCYPLVYFENKSGKLIFDYTSSRKGRNGSKIFKLMTGKKWGTLKMPDNYDKQNQFAVVKNIPIFIVFKILEEIDPTEAYEKYIKKFIPGKFRRRSMNFLNSSIVKVKNLEDYVKYLCVKRRKKFTLATRNELKEDFRQKMIENLFNNVEYKTKEEAVLLKSTLLGYFIARYTLVVIGAITRDSRDSWTSKRFDAGGTQVKILMGSVMNSLLLLCKRDILKFSTTPDFSIFGNTLRSKASNHLQRDFQSSFNTPYWGTRAYGKVKQNVTETTKRDTPLLLWSMCSKNSTDVDKRDLKMSVREVHPSQRGMHCLAETPESSSISLVKYNAITCRLSLETDETEILLYLEKYIGEEGEKIGNDTCDMILMINGKFVSHKNISLVYCLRNSKNILVTGKTTGKLPIDIEIYMDKDLDCLQVYTDSSRPMCPYFVVNQETNKLVIDEINGWNLQYKELIVSGAVEFLSSKESDSEDIVISYSVKHFKEMKEKYTTLDEYEKVKHEKLYSYSHCNIDPGQLFGLSASICPFTNHQMTTRTTFNCSMAKQALGYFNINYHNKFYGGREGFKRLIRGTRPICESETCFLPKMDVLPSGQTANIGFLTEPDNQEDSVVVSEDFINSGNLNYYKYIMVRYLQSSFQVGTREFFERPPLRLNENPSKYIHIQENGLPKLDAYMKEGDCIIGKILKTKDGSVKNNSIFCGIGEEGYVDRIIKTREKEQGNIYISIKLRIKRRYQAGDKLAIRYAQKGTIGRVEKRENLPIVSDGKNKGITPDIVFNPLGYPSRQTVGLLLEGMLSKAAIYSGKRIDSSPFAEIDTEEPKKVLKEYGFDEFGYENVKFVNGKTIDNKITIVPLYEQVLRHQTVDKIQMRSSGNKSLYTHQPRGGRSQGGGQKIGEMEKDSFVAHGATGVITERMMTVSDEFKVIVCQTCGIVIADKNCVLCGNSKPGVLTIPYVFKLLINLLNGVGIDVRINTKIKNSEAD